MDWLRSKLRSRRRARGGALPFALRDLHFPERRGFEEKFSALQNVAAAEQQVPAGHAPEIAQIDGRLQSPPQWTFSGRSGLFVPEKHFIGANGEPATLQNTLLHPPVPNEWLEEFGLPDHRGRRPHPGRRWRRLHQPRRMGGPHQPDREGIAPALHRRCSSLKSFSQEQFPLIFSSSVGDTYAINNIDPNKPTQFLKIGDIVAGTKFKVIGYTEKFDTDQYGTSIDVSELTLEQIDTHDQVTLVKEKTTTSPESVANFLYTWNGAEQTFSVKKDQEFSLKPLDGDQI